MSVANSSPPKPNIFTSIVGADKPILLRSTSRDVAALTTHGAMLCASAVFSATALDLLAEHLFTPIGIGHVFAFVSAILISVLIAAIDRAVFCQGSYLAAGVGNLEKVGVRNLGDAGVLAAAKVAAAMVVRACLGIGLSLLYSLGIGLVIYGADIRHDLDFRYKAADVGLSMAAAQRVDVRIASVGSAVQSGQASVDDLTKQQASLRSTIIDPVGSLSQVAAATAEVQRLEGLAQSANAAADSQAEVAAKELAGTRTPETSGIAGLGPRTRADQALAATDADRAKEAAGELAADRTELASLRTASAGDAGTIRSAAQGELATVSAELAAANQKLAGLETDYEKLSQDRGAEIEAELEASPGYVAPDYGPLAQVEGFWGLATGRPGAAIVMGLIDWAALMLELGFLLSRWYVQPVVFCGLLASQTFIDLGDAADAFVARFNRGSATKEHASDLPPEVAGAERREPGGDGVAIPGLMPDPSNPFMPPRRPRGRPRNPR